MTDDQSRDREGRFGSTERAEPSDSSVAEQPDLSDIPDDFAQVLRSAAMLQKVVPDAVLVGGTVSAIYAGHRVSFDHDHVLELKDRYLSILEAVEATDGWATSVRASKPPMTIMGTLGGIEAGLRQLRRTRPLETQLLDIGGGATIRIPTREEALRVKAYLVVQRNQVRDYLDVAALSAVIGLAEAAHILGHIGEYYADRSGVDESVISELVSRLADPSPRDTAALAELSRYKNLKPRWQDWTEVQRVCVELAQGILGGAR